MYVKIKLNEELRGNPKGSIIRIKVFDTDGIDYIPEDIYWRQRLKDSKIDNCIEFIYPEKQKDVKKVKKLKVKKPLKI